MMFKKIAIAALVSVAATTTHAQDAQPPRHAETGKACVTYMSSELTPTGINRLNYRNVCDSEFKVKLLLPDGTKVKTIPAGSLSQPSKAYISCRTSERCESAKWQFE